MVAVVVERGTTEVVEDGAPDAWSARETVRLFVVRLADETVVASSDLGMSFEFAETDGSVMSEIEMQAAELLGKRIRKRGEGRDARECLLD